MKHERIIEAIRNIDVESAIYVYNEWQDICNTGDHILEMEMFDELLSGFKPLDIANMVAFGSYCAADDWFTFDGYGNIKTLNDYEIIRMVELDADEIAEHCFAYDEDFGIEELREAIDEECKDE